MHEKISIERRPPSGQIEAQSPIQSYEGYKNTVKERRSKSNKKTLCKRRGHNKKEGVY